MKKTLKFTDGKELELQNIFCIGQNYELHNKEMGTAKHNDIIVFTKPTLSYIEDNQNVELPSISEMVHHEVEMVIVIGKDGRNIDKSNAKDYIAGFGIGIDFTLRDLQKKAKEKGQPWATAKGFYSSAPISKIIPIDDVHSFDFDLELKVNDDIRQSGNTRDMIFSIERLVSYISTVFGLCAGDVIFTGTPEGVNKVEIGDTLYAKLNDKLMLTVNIK